MDTVSGKHFAFLENGLQRLLRRFRSKAVTRIVFRSGIHVEISVEQSLDAVGEALFPGRRSYKRESSRRSLRQFTVDLKTDKPALFCRWRKFDRKLRTRFNDVGAGVRQRPHLRSRHHNRGHGTLIASCNGSTVYKRERSAVYINSRIGIVFVAFGRRSSSGNGR